MLVRGNLKKMKHRRDTTAKSERENTEVFFYLRISQRGIHKKKHK